MRGTRSKAIRRANVKAGLPANGRTHGPNFTDLPDTRSDRRLKGIPAHRRRYAAELRDTDPIAARARLGFWNHVRIWLTMPAYREGFGNPCKKTPRT